MKSYTELDVRMQAKALVNTVYELTKKFPKEEVFGVTSQIRRSAKETIRFLIARSSLYELETQLYLSQDQKYITQAESNEIQNQVIACKKLLNGFINYYKKR